LAKRQRRQAGAKSGGRALRRPQPAIVPQIVQKRAPDGSGAPQPEHFPAGACAGAAAGPACGAAAGATAGPETWGFGTGVPAAGAEPAPVAVLPGVPAAGVTGAISDIPQDGHTTHAGSSMILRQFVQRFGENGSTCPQNGQAATILSMNLPQYGHACLKVGIVRSYRPVMPEGFDCIV
jgi:hypothetical protein